MYHIVESLDTDSGKQRLEVFMILRGLNTNREKVTSTITIHSNNNIYIKAILFCVKEPKTLVFRIRQPLLTIRYTALYSKSFNETNYHVHLLAQTCEQS